MGLQSRLRQRHSPNEIEWTLPSAAVAQEVRAVVWQAESCRFEVCPWARHHLNSNCSSRVGCYLAWSASMYECMNGWVWGYCEALCIKSIYIWKCNPFTLSNKEVCFLPTKKNDRSLVSINVHVLEKSMAYQNLKGSIYLHESTLMNWCCVNHSVLQSLLVILLWPKTQPSTSPFDPNYEIHLRLFYILQWIPLNSPEYLA